MAEIAQEGIQTRAFVIAVMLCVALSAGFMLRSFVLLGQSPHIELDDTINPNDAPAASLMRLSGVGLSRAEGIIRYRSQVDRQNGNSQPFRDCNDLQKVRGIGPTTVDAISEWLRFE